MRGQSWCKGGAVTLHPGAKGEGNWNGKKGSL